MIATYALCGFSNLGTIGIEIGGIGPMAPSASPKLRVRPGAMLGGLLASCMTACIAAALTKSPHPAGIGLLQPKASGSNRASWASSTASPRSVSTSRMVLAEFGQHLPGAPHGVRPPGVATARAQAAPPRRDGRVHGHASAQIVSPYDAFSTFAPVRIWPPWPGSRGRRRNSNSGRSGCSGRYRGKDKLCRVPRRQAHWRRVFLSPAVIGHLRP